MSEGEYGSFAKPEDLTQNFVIPAATGVYVAYEFWDTYFKECPALEKKGGADFDTIEFDDIIDTKQLNPCDVIAWVSKLPKDDVLMSTEYCNPPMPLTTRGLLTSVDFSLYEFLHNSCAHVILNTITGRAIWANSNTDFPTLKHFFIFIYQQKRAFHLKCMEEEKATQQAKEAA